VLRDRLQAAAVGEFDAPLGLASGAGDIFGTTGGVMEATLRAASETGDRQAGRPARIHRGPRRRGSPRNLRGHRRAQHPRRRGQRIDQCQGLVGQSQGGQGAISRDRGHGLSRRLLRRRRTAVSAEGVKVLDPELLRLRAGALYAIDGKKKLRKSYENPAIEEVYSSYLGGPGNEKGPRVVAHAYHAREPRGVR